LSKTKWLAQRLAEFQFGRIIQGWFQWVLFIPVYFKMFHLKWWGVVILILAGTILTWFGGYLAYLVKLVEHYRRRELRGVLNLKDEK
jgi:hypothetical protein